MIDTVKTAVLPRLTRADVARMPVERIEEYLDDFRADFVADLNRDLFGDRRRIVALPRGHMKTAAFSYGRPRGPIPEVTGRHFTLQLQDDLMGDMLKSAYGKELVTLLSSEQPLYAAFANAKRDVGCVAPGTVVQTPPGMVSLRGVVVGPDGELEPTLAYARKPGSTPAKDAFDRAWLDRTARGSRPAGSPLWDPDEGSTVMR